jgi:site-specific DNA recombinase
MGRLMLNVLLSFAQFEREITGERIRDKIAASKKKGMWMGGTPPIGYRAENRTLVMEPEDAETVRNIFRLYLEAGSVRALAKALDERGIRTKRRTHADGTETGGGQFERGHLYGLLSNPIYIGRIGHKGQSYPGTHEPIVDPETWEAVQSRLAQNTQGPRKRARSGAKASSLLAGLLYGENGNRFTPSHATKAGRRYRYYVEQLPEGTAGTERKPWRVPAMEIEGAVRAAIGDFLALRQQVLSALGRLSAAETQQALNGAQKLRPVLADRTVASTVEPLAAMLKKVVISKDRIQISLDRMSFGEALGLSSTDEIKKLVDGATLEFEAPVRMRMRGLQTKLVVGEGPASQPRNYDLALVKAIARAHDWFGRLKSGEADSAEAIARSEGVTGAYVTRLVRLAFLQPELIERILQGTHAVGISVEHLTLRAEIPVSWREQANAFT